MFKTTKNVLLLILSLILLGVALPSWAKDLTQSHVDDFISAMASFKNTNDPALKALSDKTKFNPSKSISFSNDGRLNVYQYTIQQKMPTGSRDALQKLVKQNGFSSLEQWAQISDRMLAAYMQINLNKQGRLNNVPELTPQMRQALPPQMIAQIEQVTKIAKAVQNASAKDIALVKTNFAKIQQVLQ